MKAQAATASTAPARHPAQNHAPSSDAGTAPLSSKDAHSHPPLRSRNPETKEQKENKPQASNCDTPPKGHEEPAGPESAAHSRKQKSNSGYSSAPEAAKQIRGSNRYAAA